MKRELTPEAAAARREYYRRYREQHRERLNERRRAWYHANTAKAAAQQARYWERKGATMPEDPAE